MTAFDRVLQKARSNPRRIVLPESSDERIVRAAFEAQAQGIASPILLGDATAIRALADAQHPAADDVTVIDPANHPATDRYAELLVEKRSHRGMTLEKAQVAVQDPLVYACLMVAAGDADGCVAGAITATADVVRSAMQIVGKRAGEAMVSSFFVMLLNDSHPVKDVMVIADCALVIDPDAEGLAAIAAATGDSTKALLGIEPQVAMLSFSTAGSARHSSVSKVNKATDLARELRPDWRIVGEVQLDAAVVPGILARKSPEQASDQPCNVLVFPNLDAGNIGYKLIERFAGAQAIGPILQGLAHPVNDLSRGCSTSDVVNIMAVTAAQSLT